MIKNFFNVAGFDAVKRIAEWIRHKFYTKAEIDEMFSAGAKYEVVDELPSTGVEGTIYLVPSSTSTSGDIYDEYIYVDGDFEKIGTTKADLSNVVRVPTAGTAIGDTTHPVYVDADGEATAGSQYAGGTKLTLNGADKGADSATAYAPTAGGTSGQYLKSNGNGNAPSWETMDSSPTENSTKAVTSGGVKAALDGKQASVTITTNANTPTDNDTVIMQDSGNTSTTSFLRRKLSTLWTYIKGKDGYPEARLAWGGKHLTNATSPVDAALIPDLSANRAAFINPSCVDILYSEDGGTTWQDYGLTDWEKQRLLCDERSVIVGKRSSSQHADAQCLLRVLIHDTTSYFYAKIQKIAVYCATNGSEGCYCNVTGRKQVDINNNVDSWDTLADHVSMSGWSGWNIIQTSFITYGGNTTAYHVNNYYGQIRLDFGISGPTTADNGAGFSISRIRMYGTECWGGSMSYLAKYGNPFVLREGKKCVFEGPIAVKDGTASQVLLANGDVMSLPVPINKGGTGATTAIGAEYNILNQVADISTTLSDTRKIALCNQTKSASNGVFRWIALSNVWTYIKGKISTVLGIQEGTIDGKVNLQPDFTASQISYSAGNVGKWQKVLRIPEGADLVINMKKTAMGSDSTSTLWFSSSSMGDSYTSLFGNHSVRFIHDGGYVFLILACKKSTNEPTEYYTFQIAHSSVPMPDIVAVTDASPITATPKEPSIVYRAPITTGALSFNVSSSGAGSVYMANHNDFLGNMTSEVTDGVVVTMSGATEGQIYRFVFTRNIEGGVTFKQSNVAYCTISGDVNAGDTITLTAVSNTENGWLYEQESAGMTSTDGSVSIDYSSGIPDLSVETPTIWNDSEFFRDKKVFEIGDGAISVRRTSDIDRPYVTMFASTLLKFYVNNDTSIFYTYYPVTAGNTYHVKAVNYSTPDSELDITATQDGYLFYLNLGVANMIANNSVECYYMSGSSFAMSPLSMSLHTDTSTHSYAIITMQQVLAENLIALLINVKGSNLNPSIAFGYSTSAKGEDSIAVGQYAQANARQSLALGFLSMALNEGSVGIGHNSAAFGLYGIAIGEGSRSYYNGNIAIGLKATTDKSYSIAIGSYAKGKNETSIALGYTAQTNESNTIAIGALSFAGGLNSVAIGSRAQTERNSSTAIGNDTQAGISSNSNDRPYLNVKEFKAVQFTDGGDSVMAKICETTDDVTISVGGNNYTLTPPAEDRTLVVVNDAYAQYLYRLLTGYIKINGVAGYYAGNSTGADLPFEQLTGNYYAVWLRLAGSYATPITSLSFIASYTDTNVGDYQVAVGSRLQSFRDSCVAVGNFLMSTRAYQTVIGSGNIPDYDALFIVGAGGNVTNARKNILTIDYREQLQVKGVRTQVARMTTSGTISGVNNIYLIGSGCTVALPGTGEEGQVLKVCAEGNCTVGGVSLEAGKFREYVCAGGAWYTRE